MTSFNLYKPRATSTSALYTSSTTPPSLRQKPLPPPLLTSRRWRSGCTPAQRVYVNAFFKGADTREGEILGCIKMDYVKADGICYTYRH